MGHDLVVETRTINKQVTKNREASERSNHKIFATLSHAFACKDWTPVDFHPAQPTFPLLARVPESERWIDVISNMAQHIDHAHSIEVRDLVAHVASRNTPVSLRSEDCDAKARSHIGILNGTDVATGLLAISGPFVPRVTAILQSHSASF
jgi:hypothetical protein